MTTNTINLGQLIQTPGDPAVANVWGANLNDNFDILDLVGGGYLSLSVAGNSNVILSNTPGSTGQSLNAHFVLTGVLTGNIVVLWPSAAGRMFSVANNTTGAFTLQLGANNGSGSAAGNTVTITQGATLLCYSDGTNVAIRQSGNFSSVTSLGDGSFGGQVSTNTGGFSDTSGSGFVTAAFGITTTLSVSGITAASASPTSFSIIMRTNGVILSDGGTTWGGISDYRAKDVFGRFEKASEIVAAVPVYRAALKTPPQSVKAMFLAHEVQAHIPYAVHGVKDGKEMQILDSTDPLIPILWATCQELLGEVAALKASRGVV